MKIYFATFYLSWIVLTVLIASLPFPAQLDPFFYSFLSIFVLGVYLLVLFFLSRIVIREVSTRKPKELLSYFAIVAIFLVVFFFGRQLSLSSGVVGGALATVNLLFGATLLGCFLATAIKRVGEMIPVCITAAVADGISVTKGPTKTMIGDISAYYTGGGEGVAPMVDFILVKIALPGAERLVPVFGITDWIFVVLLSAALYRLNLSDSLLPGRFNVGGFLVVPVAGLSLYVSIIIAQLTGLFLPAMAGIASLFLLFLVVKYSLHKQMRPMDIYYTLFFSGAVTVLLLVYATKVA